MLRRQRQLSANKRAIQPYYGVNKIKIELTKNDAMKKLNTMRLPLQVEKRRIELKSNKAKISEVKPQKLVITDSKIVTKPIMLDETSKRG